MAKKTRNYKRAQNNKAINEFLNEIIGVTSTGSRRAVTAMADRGIKRLVHNVAGFSDYTGVLINSYQAAVYQNGEFRTRGGRHIKNYRGDFNYTGDALRSYGNTFRNNSGSAILFTSYGVGPTGLRGAPISFKTIKNKGGSIEKSLGRNPKSKDAIRNYWKKRPKEYQGYGRKTANVKAYSPSIKYGFEVVFDNPAPYAQFVQENNKGSRVMPTGAASIMPRGLAISIATHEINRELQKARARRKKK